MADHPPGRVEAPAAKTSGVQPRSAHLVQQPCEVVMVHLALGIHWPGRIQPAIPPFVGHEPKGRSPWSGGFLSHRRPTWARIRHMPFCPGTSPNRAGEPSRANTEASGRRSRRSAMPSPHFTSCSAAARNLFGHLHLPAEGPSVRRLVADGDSGEGGRVVPGVGTKPFASPLMSRLAYPVAYEWSAPGPAHPLRHLHPVDPWRFAAAGDSIKPRLTGLRSSVLLRAARSRRT